MIVSIDIGTSYSSMSMIGPDGKPVSVAIGEDGTVWGSKTLLPSAVFVEDNGNILVGQAAMRSRLRKPDCFRMEFKRNLGEDTPLLLGGRSFRVEELYTELLLHMKACVKKITDEDIELAYLTCPATYRKDKKERLISAAKAAGLFQVELVPEPTAAAMSYVSAGYVKDGQTLLVYDFGGGTFDAALIQYKGGAFLPLGEPLGLPRCGGIDMDRLIYQDMMKAVDPDTLAMLQKKQEKYLRFAGKLSENAVSIKRHLSSAQTATEFISLDLDEWEYVLDREHFEQMIAPMVSQTIHVCEDALTSAGLEKSGLSAVVLVGGTSRVPLVQQMVQQFAGKVPVYAAPDVDLAVVQGALSYRLYNEAGTAEKWYQDAKKLEGQGGSFEEMADLYRKAAEQGHAEAQCQLGFCYACGTGVGQDFVEAVKWYRKAAEQGHAGSQYELGRCYFDGTGVEQDHTEAVRWYRKAAEQGDAAAQHCLGFCYDHGTGVGQDNTEAVNWYHKAAKQGLAEAQYNLGTCYAHGNGVRKDPAEAVNWYRKAAKQGLAEAQYNLGVCYYTGTGVEKDPAEAVNWCRKAAEQGLAEAQYVLGCSYDDGIGVEQDPAEAVKWYRKAAEQGHEKAQCDLGLCYFNGISGEQSCRKDYEEAVKWFQKAAIRGHVEAQYMLGICYENGKGVEQNRTDARVWYHRAASKGYAEAQYKLGVLDDDDRWYLEAAHQGHVEAQYKLGEWFLRRGINKEAENWLLKAAEQGHVKAQYNLGRLYESVWIDLDGLANLSDPFEFMDKFMRNGPSRRKVEAAKWYSKAAAQGDEDAQKALRRLHQK